MTTINLQKDLEAWYDFGSRDFDSQRNLIQDKSGYGRHAEASGGPTVGVNGPASFGGVDFDGTDDMFEFANAPDIVGDGTQPFSLFSIAKIDSDMTEGRADLIRVTDSNYSGLEARNGGEIGFAYDPEGTDGYNRTPRINAGLDKFFSVAAVYTGSELLLSLPDEKIAGTIDINDNPPSGIVIGEYSLGGTFDGIISVSAAWSRALSDAEIESLHRMTAPRRAML